MASLKKRGKTWYAQCYVGGRPKRVSLHTTSLQVAKEKLRQFKSARYKGEESAGPTRTKLADILTRYAEHVRTCPHEKLHLGGDVRPRLAKFMICRPRQWCRRNRQDLFHTTGGGTGS